MLRHSDKELLLSESRGQRGEKTFHLLGCASVSHPEFWHFINVEGRKVIINLRSYLKGSLCGTVYLTLGFKCLWSQPPHWQLIGSSIQQPGDRLNQQSHYLRLESSLDALEAARSISARDGGADLRRVYFNIPLCLSGWVFCSGATQAEGNLISSHWMKKDPNCSLVYKGLWECY